MLYLLGIPLAIAGMKILHDDIKYTSMDLRTPKAAHNLSLQYKQIDEHYIDILRYGGAKCDIKQIGHNKYDIKNVKRGQYGGMEKYLAEKGYFPQAINYAKKQFDKLADEEEKIKSKQRNEAINRYERKLLTERTENVVITINFNKFSCNKSGLLVEKDVKKLIDYFHTHNNKNVFCNIIMENDNYWHHKEVWHIKKPISENAKDYYNNVYEEVINNKSSTKTQDISVIADSKWKTCPKCGAKIPKAVKDCHYCKSSSNIKNNENKWKTCPDCNKKINKVAKNCPYCNHEFKEVINNKPSNKTQYISAMDILQPIISAENKWKTCPKCGAKIPKAVKDCYYCKSSSNIKNNENKWKTCPDCNKKINKVAKECPYCYYDFINNKSKKQIKQSETSSQDLGIKWKTCPDCNKKINEVAKKCPYCNHEFKEVINNKPSNKTQDISVIADSKWKTCPKCGAKLGKDYNFCINCGTKIDKSDIK